MQENFSIYRFTVVYCNPTIIMNQLEDGFWLQKDFFEFLENSLIDEYPFKAAGRLV